jgi:hypothetical protein
MSSWVGSQLLLHQAAQVKRGMHAFSLVWNILIFFRNHLCCLVNAKGSDLACAKRTHTYIGVAVLTKCFGKY